MKFATLRQGAAVLVDDVAYLLPMSVLQLIELGLERALEIGADAQRGESIAFSEGDLLLPYTPPSVRDFVTFESHVEGVRRSIDNASGIPEAWYDAPTFYFTNPHALYGPGEPIPRPVTCRALDFEMEVACIVGSTLRSATVEEAEAAIFGFTILNDWSARDIQSREMQVGLGPAKGKDFATSFGPWIVTSDELPSLDLDCTVWVNGELIGHDNLSSMNWTFAEMIAHASRDSVVLAGDLLASGTTGGGGCLAELWGRNGTQTPPPLEDGDAVLIEVQHLGSLLGRIAVHDSGVAPTSPRPSGPPSERVSPCA